jgi:hypothetical protein
VTSAECETECVEEESQDFQESNEHKLERLAEQQREIRAAYVLELEWIAVAKQEAIAKLVEDTKKMQEVYARELEDLEKERIEITRDVTNKLVKAKKPRRKEGRKEERKVKVKVKVKVKAAMMPAIDPFRRVKRKEPEVESKKEKQCEWPMLPPPEVRAPRKRARLLPFEDITPREQLRLLLRETAPPCAPTRDRRRKQDENEFAGDEQGLSRAKIVQLPLELGDGLKVIAFGRIVTD